MQEKYESVLKNIPAEGFIKLTSAPSAELTVADKAALIRKGNAFFNSGEFEKAKRIFITTKYTDGLIRIGDWHLKKGDMLEAVRMYWLAPAPDKIETWTEKAAGAVSKWLKQ